MGIIPPTGWLAVGGRVGEGEIVGGGVYLGSYFLASFLHSSFFQCFKLARG